MGVQSEGLGRYLNRDDLSLKVVGNEITSTTHAAVEVGDHAVLNLEVVVTGTPGGTSPTLLLTIEGSNDAFDWYTLGRIGSNGFGVGPLGTAPADIRAAGTYRAAIPAARFVRSKSTIGGTSPDFTYSVGGSAA